MSLCMTAYLSRFSHLSNCFAAGATTVWFQNGKFAQGTRDMRDCGRDELQYRWFFHLSVEGPTEETWRHGEHAEDGSVIHPFDFFWADVRALPKLVANYDDKIDLLVELMNARKSYRWRTKPRT